MYSLLIMADMFALWSTFYWTRPTCLHYDQPGSTGLPKPFFFDNWAGCYRKLWTSYIFHNLMLAFEYISPFFLLCFFSIIFYILLFIVAYRPSNLWCTWDIRIKKLELEDCKFVLNIKQQDYFYQSVNFICDLIYDFALFSSEYKTL